MRLLQTFTRTALVLTLALATPALAWAQPPAGQQDEFVPVTGLPVQEQLPAAPLLIAAYVFVLAALFVYVVSLSKRFAAVRRDVERLEGELKRRGRA